SSVRTLLPAEDPGKLVKKVFDRIEGKPLLPSCYVPPCFEHVLKKGVDFGERDECAIRIASYLKTKKVPIAEITSILLEWNKKNRPPLDSSVIPYKVSSAEKGYTFSCDKLRGCASFEEGCDEKICRFGRGGEAIVAETESIIKIPPEVKDDPYLYKIRVRGQEFLIKSDLLLTPHVFRRKWYETFNEVIRFTQKGWEEVLDAWGAMMQIGEEDRVSDENFVVEEILRRIGMCGETREREEVVVNERYVLVEKESDEVLLYPNHHLKRIVDACGVRVSLRRLRDLLRPYLAGDSKVVRVGETQYRFWVFKKASLVGGSS
ncbi:MAG: hypothetical protein QMC85_07030, partial [Methanocellales archaeon]|nr:hypothetical protein [Methanocellales archaeon]